MRMTTLGIEERSARSALLLSLLASLLYGSQYVVIKDGMGDINPLLFGSMTMGIGGLLTLVMVRRRKRMDLSILTRWEVWAGAFFATSLIACQYVGLTLSAASVGGLIVGSNVIFVAPLSALIFRERIGRWETAGVMVGLLGLITITTGWDLSFLSSSEFTGDLLLLVASFSIAANYPLTKVALRIMGNDEWVMAIHLLSALSLFPLGVLVGGPGDLGSTSFPALLYVGMFCTAVPTLLWAIGLRSLSLTTSATVLLSESAFAVLLGVVILNEPLNVMIIIGAALVFLAIFTVSRSLARG